MTQPSLSVEELMKPRYKVIAEYPHMENDQIGLGDIISPYAMGFMYPEKVKEMYDKYPHLFKKLEWWEEREEGEMPAYIQCWPHKTFHKVDEWGTGYFIMEGLKKKRYENYLPATESEYTNYINSLK